MKTQKEWFAELTIDHLLSLRKYGLRGKQRWTKQCIYPRFEGDTEGRFIDDGLFYYPVDYELLRAEMITRPHRVRARDRRKSKNKSDEKN